MTIAISWTAMRAHEECKQKSYLIRSGKRAKSVNIRGYYHGMVVDSLMRRWLDDPHRSAGDMAASVDEAIDLGIQEAMDSGDGVVRWRDSNDRGELRQFCVDLVGKLEPILHTLVLPYPFESPRGFRVNVTVPGPDGTPTTIVLRGEMDLLVHEPTRWVVWDLKGTRDDSYWRKVVGQLIFYDLAVLCLHGESTGRAGLIQPMCTKPVLEFVFTDDDRRSMWARILRMAADIWANDTACKADTHGCAFCEVKHACPRFAPTPGGTSGNTVSLGMGTPGSERR